jgi:hypothetical protein
MGHSLVAGAIMHCRPVLLPTPLKIFRQNNSDIRIQHFDWTYSKAERHLDPSLRHKLYKLELKNTFTEIDLFQSFGANLLNFGTNFVYLF